MRRTIGSLAVPPAIGHLFPEQVVGKRVEPLVLVLEVAEDREHHAGDARLAAPAPPIINTAVALKSPVQQQRAGPPRLPVLRRQTKVTQQEHGVGGGGPFRGIQPAIPRPPAGPCALPILPRQEARVSCRKAASVCWRFSASSRRCKEGWTCSRGVITGSRESSLETI